MASGIRAKLAVHAPSECPVAPVAAEARSRVTGISWTRVDTDGPGEETPGSTAVEEFRVPVSASHAVPDEADPLLDIGDRRLYRIQREQRQPCACERIEALGCPIDHVQATEEGLVLTLHLPELEELRTVVGELAETADRVEVRSLVHGETGIDVEKRPVVVDRGQLTDRQREVLRTAVEMGYFEYPRDSNATEVAETLDIDLSTFAQHLAAAQSKLFDGALSA